MHGVIVALLVCVLAGGGIACHPGPIVNATEIQVGGTIAGIVTATGGAIPLEGRRVTATNLGSGATYAVTTSSAGGYTLKVPEGSYRLDVELRAGETLSRRPDDTEVNNGDLDPDRDFDVTVQATR